MKDQNKLPSSEAAMERCEWDFDDVPDGELIACCFWEYGRESNFLRSIKERSAEAVRLKLGFKERLEFVERDFSKCFGVLGRSAIFFQEGIYRLGGDKAYHGLISRFPEPWQWLSKSEKSALLETANWDAKYVAGFPGFKRSNLPRAEAIVKFFRPKSVQEVFGGEGVVGVREYFHAGDKLRSLCPCYMYPEGLEVLLVEIDWGNFTNEQLVQEFAQWLKENNPPGVSRPDNRGHKKITDRVKLERLGILRLLNRFTLSELKAACPPAWRQYNTPNRRWRKEASMARIHFREMFPFLPGNEAPISWLPKETGHR